MKYDTISEKLFADICKRHGYTCNKLPTSTKEGVKSADFEVRAPTIKVIAEIKELSPNEDDLRQIREIKENHFSHGSDIIGARARSEIRRASKQLRHYATDQIPLIVVLYDNVRTEDGRVGYPMFYLESYQIDAAMYGDRTVNIQIGPTTTIYPDRNGGKRTTTSSEKNYLSAVAVISDWDNETLYIYHNYFATTPLPLDLFDDSKTRHFYKSENVHSEPWTWHKRM